MDYEYWDTNETRAKTRTRVLARVLRYAVATVVIAAIGFLAGIGSAYMWDKGL